MIDTGRRTSFPSPLESGVRLILLWAFFLLVPTLLVRSFLVRTLEEEAADRTLTARRECFSEMRGFSRSLRRVGYLEKCLEFHSPEGLTKRANIPWVAGLGLSISRTDLAALRKIIHRKTGINPLYVLVVGESPEECRGYFSPGLRKRVHWNSFRKDLPDTFMAMRYRYYREYMGEGRKRNFPVPKEEKDIARPLLGLNRKLRNPMMSIDERFSFAFHHRCHVATIPVFSGSSGTIHHFIQVGFLDDAVSMGGMLRRAAEKNRKSGFRRILKITGQRSLPRFEEKGKELVFLEALPFELLETFGRTDQYKKLRERKWMPVLGILVEQNLLESPFQPLMPAFDLLFALIALIGIPLFRGVLSEKSVLKSSLGGKMTFAFVLVVIIPLGGMFWIGSSYLGSEKKLRVEETLDIMAMELEKLDRTIISFDSTVSRLIEKIRRKAHSKLWETRSLTKLVRSLGDKGLILAYYMFRTDDWELFHRHGDPSDSIKDKIRELFRGPVLDALMNTGGFREKIGSAGTMEKYQNLIAFSFSLMEKNFDISFFGRLLGRPGALFDHPLSANFHQISSVFFRDFGKPPGAIGFLTLSMENRFRNYFSWLKEHASRLNRKQNGFNIFFHLYRIPSNGSDHLDTNWSVKGGPPFADQLEGRLSYGESINALRSNVRLNNLNAKSPHLACSRLMGGKSLFGLAYAEPDGKDSGMASPRILGGIALYGLFLAFLIARFTSLLLTRPIQAFLEAMNATRSGNFRWRIDWEDRDEFGELASSFNRMAVGLQEKEKMSRLVSEDVLQAVAADDESALKPGGQRVEATVLFSDIRGFTTLSEQHSPGVIVEMLNDYFTVMARCIKDHHGVLDKFIGDAIQAVFYPQARGESQAMLACRAALAMRQALDRFNARRREEGKFQIQNGIGLASGMVVSGCVGSSRGRLDYTVIGRTLQIAVRLEAESKRASKTGIMVEPVTIRQTRGAFRIGYLDRMDLESGTRSVPVYELLSARV